MKKAIVLLIAVMPCIVVLAQNSKVVTAFRYLGDYNESKDVESLGKAREAIDAAALDEGTSKEAKTFLFRGQIYFALFEYNLRVQTELPKNISDPNKRAVVGYQNTSRSELDTAYSSYTRCARLDEKGKLKGDVKNGLDRIVANYQNKAISDLNLKKYPDALYSFEKTLEINGDKDTSTLFKCAVTAEKSDNFEKTKYYYQKMIDNNQRLGLSYNSLVDLLYKANDSTKANEVLKKGRAAVPNDVNLLIKEINFYMATNKTKEAIENLDKAIAAKPTDEMLYFSRGNLWDNLANPKDKAGKALDRPNDFAMNIANAEADYRKALELKPELFVALYNLGVIYNNEGQYQNTLADKVATDKAADKIKYDELNNKSIDSFKKAMPIFEKALTANPKSKNTMIALKQIYARLGMEDKLKEMNEKMKAN